MPLEREKTQVDEALPDVTPAVSGLYHVAGRLLCGLFYLTVGMFLLVFPWVEYWNDNYFSSFSTKWYAVWNNSYFRGAVSGLGIVNVYFSLLESFRLRRIPRS